MQDQFIKNKSSLMNDNNNHLLSHGRINIVNFLFLVTKTLVSENKKNKEIKK